MDEHGTVVTNVDASGHVPPQLDGVNTYRVDTNWPLPGALGQPAEHWLTTVAALNTQSTGPLLHEHEGNAGVHDCCICHVDASGHGVPPLVGAAIMYRDAVCVPCVGPHATEHWLKALKALITHGVGAAVVGDSVGTNVDGYAVGVDVGGYAVGVDVGGYGV